MRSEGRVLDYAWIGCLANGRQGVAEIFRGSKGEGPGGLGFGSFTMGVRAQTKHIPASRGNATDPKLGKGGGGGVGMKFTNLAQVFDATRSDHDGRKV